MILFYVTASAAEKKQVTSFFYTDLGHIAFRLLLFHKNFGSDTLLFVLCTNVFNMSLLQFVGVELTIVFFRLIVTLSSSVVRKF